MQPHLCVHGDPKQVSRAGNNNASFNADLMHNTGKIEILLSGDSFGPSRLCVWKAESSRSTRHAPTQQR